MENPKLTDDEQQELEDDRSKEELLNALKGFKENKTPGEDGFTKEFYETFFDLIGGRLLDSYNEAFDKGKMSISQRRGIISLRACLHGGRVLRLTELPWESQLFIRFFKKFIKAFTC